MYNTPNLQLIPDPVAPTTKEQPTAPLPKDLQSVTERLAENRKDSQRRILRENVGPDGLNKSKNLKKTAENNAKTEIANVDEITEDFINEMNKSSSGVWMNKVESVARQTALKFKEVSF